jgi:hypothetical protein
MFVILVLVVRVFVGDVSSSSSLFLVVLFVSSFVSFPCLFVSFVNEKDEKGWLQIKYQVDIEYRL